MERETIKFKANAQELERITPLRTFASDTINYIRAEIALGEMWKNTQFTELYAIWWKENESGQYDTLLNADANGCCAVIIPPEALTRPGTLRMNLCGNIVEDEVLKCRLTTYSCEVLKLVKTKLGDEDEH